jgi:hypothetical protein
VDLSGASIPGEACGRGALGVAGPQSFEGAALGRPGAVSHSGLPCWIWGSEQPRRRSGVVSHMGLSGTILEERVVLGRPGAVSHLGFPGSIGVEQSALGRPGAALHLGFPGSVRVGQAALEKYGRLALGMPGWVWACVQLHRAGV